MKKAVILCGSMKVKNTILEVKEKLEKSGFNVLLPEECMKGINKSEASRAHFDRIIANDAYVLVVNVEKNGIKDYIGPNSLCEIAFSFFYNKKIFLLNDFYEPYRDELEGWKVIPLNGDLNKIKDF
ncbi:MAG: hypothetical protein J6K45_02675 [Clostridia bacterium]|nr:hypothetical protein [Clostridia bacterium]